MLAGARLKSEGVAPPCAAGRAASGDACCARCAAAEGCVGWTFTRDFDCTWTGEAPDSGVCYLLEDVALAYAPAEGGTTYESAWLHALYHP